MKRNSLSSPLLRTIQACCLCMITEAHAHFTNRPPLPPGTYLAQVRTPSPSAFGKGVQWILEKMREGGSMTWVKDIKLSEQDQKALIAALQKDVENLKTELTASRIIDKEKQTELEKAQRRIQDLLKQFASLQRNSNKSKQHIIRIAKQLTHTNAELKQAREAAEAAQRAEAEARQREKEAREAEEEALRAKKEAEQKEEDLRKQLDARRTVYASLRMVLGDLAPGSNYGNGLELGLHYNIHRNVGIIGGVMSTSSKTPGIGTNGAPDGATVSWDTLNGHLGIAYNLLDPSHLASIVLGTGPGLAQSKLVYYAPGVSTNDPKMGDELTAHLYAYWMVRAEVGFSIPIKHNPGLILGATYLTRPETTYNDRGIRSSTNTNVLYVSLGFRINLKSNGQQVDGW